jgi:phospholipid/cholesterol/gamma-HCH transport system substrate-binding protein
MALKSFRDRSPYIVGVLSVFFIVVATAAAFAVGYRHLLEHAYSMQGVFADSGGIRGGDNVLVAGIKVGRVIKVSADPLHGNVIVRWNVRDGVDLGPDTHAEVVLETLLGTRALRLSGPVVKPYMASLPGAQRTVPLPRTGVPFDIFALTKNATLNIEQTDTARLNRLIGDLADITQGKRDQITTLLSSVASLSSTLNQRDTQVRELLDRANQLSKILADKDQTLAGLIDQSRGILQEIQRRRTDIASGLTDANHAFGDLAQIVDANKSVIDSILTTLHPTLDTVSRHQQDIATSLAELGPGLLTQSAAASHGPWGDIYVRALGVDIISCVQHLAGQISVTPVPPACAALPAGLLP